MDNKSSPLALLAQTCSAIGADTANPKLLAANIEKSTKSLKTGMHNSGGSSSNNNGTDARDKSSPISSHSSSVSTGSVEQQQQQQQQQTTTTTSTNSNKSGASFKPYESNNNHIHDNVDLMAAANLSTHVRSKTPSKANGRCDSNQSASSSQRGSPATGVGATASGASLTPTTTNGNMRRSTPNSIHEQQQYRLMSGSPVQTQLTRASSKESATTAPSPIQIGTSRLQAASEAALAAAAKEASYVKALHAAAAAAGMPPSTTAQSNSPYYSTGYPGSGSGGSGGMPYPMELMAASALMSPHHPMFKAAAMNPYLNYARLKGLDATTAAAMMSAQTVNVCRDPYCTGCPSSPHFLNKAAGQPCPAGCPQCESSGKSSSSSSASNAAAAAAVAASSYHAQLAALAAASQMPYVCSWIGSDAAYCGKRFGTSDELFQHLRTHTASVPDSVLSAAAAGGIPPNHPLFQRTYPTPPLSPLSAAARYHPYGKPSMLPPSLGPPGLPGLPPHPALAQYFSPYSLYGPRMGSSHP